MKHHKTVASVSEKIHKVRSQKETELFLSYVQIEYEEFDEICGLDQLNKLSLTSCQLKMIPPDLSNLRNLSELVLATNDLDERSIQFADMMGLEILNLANNNFSTLLSSSIPSKLKELILHSNPIQTFPPETAEKISDTLTLFKLSSCKLEKVPESILLFHNLVELNLNNNSLTSFPLNKESFFPCLQLLDLSGNKFEVFPYEEAPEKSVGDIFPKLKQLTLYSNKLHFIHKDFNLLKNLSVLDLQDNKLTNINSLMGLSALKVLNLGNNEIIELPEDIGSGLSALERLSIPYNNIETLPESFSLLSLKLLELIGNKIYDIPTQLKDLKYERQKIIDENVADNILPNLYISNFVFPKNKHALRKLSITHIVTVIRGQPLYPTDFKYLMIPIDDSPKENILHYFPQTYEFISQALESGTSVLVHCSAGISRSASVVIAFLMRHKSITFEEAYQFLKKCRPMINPNSGFRIQLQQYETQLKLKKNNCKVQ